MDAWNSGSKLCHRGNELKNAIKAAAAIIARGKEVQALIQQTSKEVGDHDSTEETSQLENIHRNDTTLRSYNPGDFRLMVLYFVKGPVSSSYDKAEVYILSTEPCIVIPLKAPRTSLTVFQHSSGSKQRCTSYHLRRS